MAVKEILGKKRSNKGGGVISMMRRGITRIFQIGEIKACRKIRMIHPVRKEKLTMLKKKKMLTMLD